VSGHTANARLIAAAHAMREALENARETIAYIRQYVAGQGLSAEGDCGDALDAIDAALNKAQGSVRE
jgi:hypothetical protein